MDPPAPGWGYAGVPPFVSKPSMVLNPSGPYGVRLFAHSRRCGEISSLRVNLLLFMIMVRLSALNYPTHLHGLMLLALSFDFVLRHLALSLGNEP